MEDMGKMVLRITISKEQFETNSREPTVIKGDPMPGKITFGLFPKLYFVSISSNFLKYIPT